MNLSLIRLEETEEGCVGVLKLNDILFCCTLERPWVDNKRSISCIPTGSYIIKPVISPTYGSTWEVKDVPQRSHILLHAGNRIKDTEGCILLGQKFGILRNERAILSSRSAVRLFKLALRNQSAVPLTIASI